MEKKECSNCNSKNTYFTKKTKFCRACGYEENRKIDEVHKSD